MPLVYDIAFPLLKIAGEFRMSQETPISNPLSEAPRAPAVVLAPLLRASTRRPFVKPQLVKHGSVAAITNDFGGSANPG